MNPSDHAYLACAKWRKGRRCLRGSKLSRCQECMETVLVARSSLSIIKMANPMVICVDCLVACVQKENVNFMALDEAQIGDLNDIVQGKNLEEC